MVDSGIILKIQKLLALASSSNENEAQAAMMKAQEMLAKYKLSMKDVQSRRPESKAVKRCTAVTFTKAAWKGHLASVIADNFCCYMYLLTARSHQVVFMGLPEDAETAAAKRILPPGRKYKGAGERLCPGLYLRTFTEV
jgi:hypothetical protein